jgi:predicted DCC family thiol-disulfide oxidoreductase YuxK
MSKDNPPRDTGHVIVYDGQCEFCTVQAQRLAGKSGVVLRSFHDDGVLDDYATLTLEACMEEMKLVGPGGRIYGGAEAVVRAFAIRYRLLGRLLFAYYVPGLRQIADRAYAWVARNRYRLPVKSVEQCDTGSCRRHGS